VTEPSTELLRILHLSDTHLFGADPSGTGDRPLHYGRVDTTAALRRVLDRASVLTRLDLVVASGDLSDDGSPDSYRQLRELIDPWAAARGADVLYAMGNHDLREGFEAVLGARERVATVRGRRIIVLDSSVPGAGYGAVDAAQLERLRAELAVPAEYGSVLVLHHPPVPAPTPLLAALQLQDPQPLLEVCAAGDVRVILAGHYHHPLATSVRGIDVFVAPGVANTTDVTACAGHESARTGAGFALVELPARGPARCVPVTAPAPDDGTVIFDLPPDEVRRIAIAAGPAA
jgi:3',5'-cyclic AMP phosphodiesterase CpdA